MSETQSLSLVEKMARGICAARNAGDCILGCTEDTGCLQTAFAQNDAEYRFARAAFYEIEASLTAEREGIKRLRDHLARLLMAHDGVPVNVTDFNRWIDEARAALSKGGPA